MLDDRFERCLLAGMDGYVSKPIRGKELFDTIDRLTPLGAKSDVKRSEDEKAGNQGREALDQDTAVARLGGDLNLFKKLAELFLSNSPGLMSEIRESVLRVDGQTLERASHKLRGSAGYFCAESVQKAALTLETLGRNGDLFNAEATCRELEEAMQVLNSQLETLTKEDAQ
jgi:HPt (histidine-containing phosphotransfer) domain-containing protein